MLTSNITNGTYFEWGLQIELVYAGDPAVITYTLDGSDPALSSTAINYTPPITLSAGRQSNNIFLLKAVAVEIVTGIQHALSELYVLSRPIELIASVAHGYHIDKTPIELSVNTPADIYYTIDGTDVFDINGLPTVNAIAYTAAIEPIGNEFTLKAAAVSDLGTPAARYSNYISNYYLYEEDVLFIDANPAGGVFPETSLDISLGTNVAGAVIKFTLDGTSPLGDTALTYNGNAINLSTSLDSHSFRLRAIAISDRLISQPIDNNYTLYNYDSDADGDEISNGLEGGPLTDTDGDGIADMYDTDSDNDGIPDYVEGLADANANSIPAFQDATETRFWYEINGLPANGDIINGLQYEIKIICYGSEGYLQITSDSQALIFSETELTIQPGIEKSIYMYVPEIMENKCSTLWPTDAFNSTFAMSHFENGILVTDLVKRTYTIKPYTDEMPYVGNLVTWEKNAKASFYCIYRKSPGESDFVRIAKILHDSYHTRIASQQYLDRDGELLSQYRVSAIINNTETAWSNVLHAADCYLDTCTITGHLAEINNTPMADMRVSVRIHKPVFFSNNTYASAYELHTYTDAFGQFNLQLPKGSVCILKIDQAGVREKLAIPMLDFIDINELIAMNRGV